MTQGRSITVIFVLWTIYMLTSASQAPLLPYLWEHLSGNAYGYGVLMSEYGALQLIGSLVSGPFIDELGPRIWLGISLAALSVSCAITGLASATWVMYASRLPALLELGPLSTRALIAERTSDQDRVRMLGYVGACMGISFVVGPSLGGWLTAVSFRLCAWSAAVVAMLSVAAVQLISPAGESHAFAKLRQTEECVELQPEHSAGAQSDLSGHDHSHNDPHSNQNSAQEPLDKRQEHRLSQDFSRQADALDHDPEAQIRVHSRRKRKLSLESSLSLEATRASSAFLSDVGPLEISASAAASRAASMALPAGRASGQEEEEGTQLHMQNRFRHLWNTCCHPGVPSLIIIKVLVGFPLSMMQTTLSLLLQQHYKLTPQANGYVLSWFGVLFVLVQSTAVGPISKRLTVNQVMLGFGLGAVVSFAGLALSAFSIWALVSVMAPLVFCALLLETVTTAQLTKVVHADSKGTVLSLEASVFGACTMVAPSIATALFKRVGFAAIGIAGSTTTFIMVCLVGLGFLKV